MVIQMGHFSAWAGSMALAIIMIPVVVRTTEDMLRLVPSALREAAAALGAPKWKVVVMVAYRAAIQGMLTGVLLALARISGETAPLLFTALNNQFWSVDLNAPMANLPVVIFQFAMSLTPIAESRLGRRAADHRGHPGPQHYGPHAGRMEQLQAMNSPVASRFGGTAGWTPVPRHPSGRRSPRRRLPGARESHRPATRLPLLPRRPSRSTSATSSSSTGNSKRCTTSAWRSTTAA